MICLLMKGCVISGLKNTITPQTASEKIKTPSWENLFYFAATLFKLGDEKNAAETLQQATKMTDLSVEDFLLTQHYQNPELQLQLQNILQAIPV